MISVFVRVAVLEVIREAFRLCLWDKESFLSSQWAESVWKDSIGSVNAYYPKFSFVTFLYSVFWRMGHTHGVGKHVRIWRLYNERNAMVI